MEVEKKQYQNLRYVKRRCRFFCSYCSGCKKPEPYKGKGIRYIDEVVKRKQGKKSAK